MSQSNIRAVNLSKRYRLGRQRPSHTLRDAISGVFARASDGFRRRPAETLWALKDVSFEIRPGQAVGIIGRNGAGKSTLLKILSRITEPTEGWAEVRGRVGALLEVGTGFHPELSGRENIFLNGAILGMRRAEIARKFDQIVAFAEVERFLDTPVKHYSSGMYVRLAFAVAAHLEPEILVVDEVLAVGDAAFQKKCLGKMGEVAHGGRTVLLVSHNMGAIRTLTDQTMWLEQGRVKQIGPSHEVVSAYLTHVDGSGGQGSFDAAYLRANRARHPKYVGQMLVERVELRDASGRVSGGHFEGAELSMDVTVSVSAPVSACSFYVFVRTAEGQLVSVLRPPAREGELAPGAYRVGLRWSLQPLLPGRYRGELMVNSQLPQDHVNPGFEFEIFPNPQRSEDASTVLMASSSPAATPSSYAALGIIRMPIAWDTLERQQGAEPQPSLVGGAR